ncbi:MAG: succinate dehydrogenase cytochrome b subunit [Bacteroidetes bacterium]|nr:succinate dehydrogenase cytochrome b subunit [Bacteroidota bacterium]MBU1114347.1 succinate dehydrogenase cytochrome b subunit [Bacteroidota bacterium]MBU1797770.1 succinate dehydrogenase cytochrome b subunit [Bacteroidota bacterium]
MSWLSKSLSSSIGKKIIMAITGLSLILFLTVHFINNMFLFFGKEGFDMLVSSLDAVKPIVRVAESMLVILFGFHIYNGIKLWWENRQANPEKYAVNAAKENSTFFSRTMPYTGGIILVFLILHLASLWVKFNFGMEGTHHYYDVVAATFQSLPVAIFYVFVMLVLGFHLNHGFQSAFQTFGWHHKKYTPLVEFIGTAYAVVFAIGFSAIPIYFFIRSMGGN